MYYTIYKTTNLIDGKFYVGKHQTKNLDDGYLGSGKYLKRAIKKYGIENFYKEILYVFDNEQQMNLTEKILVVPDIETNYNLCSGGKGGFGYLNSTGLNKSENQRIAAIKTIKEKNINQYCSAETRSKAMKEYYSKTTKRNRPFLNRKHVPSTLEKMRNAKVGIYNGEKNPSFGTVWITNGINNKKIKKEVLDEWINKGYSKGRI